MNEINFTEIFRIGDDGIYYNDGVLYYKDIEPKGCLYGEQFYDEGKFSIVFFTKDRFTVIFPIVPIYQNGLSLSDARAKVGTFILHLQMKGIEIITF